MAEVSEEVHIQATFFTDNEKIAVPSTPFSLPLTATRNDLTKLINELISSSDDDNLSSEQLVPNAEFDFLINGSLMQATLAQLIDTLQLKTEAVIQIECVERNPPPSLDREFPHNDWVSAVHCNEQYILTGSYDSSIHIWSQTGNSIGLATEHEREISSVAWLPKSHDDHMMFVSVSHDQHACIWEFNELSKEIDCLVVCKGHSRMIEAMDVCVDGEKFCTGGVDKLLKVWSAKKVDKTDGEDPAIGRETMKKPRLMDDIRKPQSRTPLVTFSGHTHPIMCLKWNDPSCILSAGFDHCIREWDVQTGVNINTMNGSKVFLTIDKSQDDHVIASGHADRHVRLWDSRISSTGSLVTQVLSSHRGWVKGVCFSPVNSHQLVSGSYDNTVKLWDIRSPSSPLYTIAAHEDKLLCLDWSIPKLIASGGSDNILRTFTF